MTEQRDATWESELLALDTSWRARTAEYETEEEKFRKLERSNAHCNAAWHRVIEAKKALKKHLWTEWPRIKVLLSTPSEIAPNPLAYKLRAVLNEYGAFIKHQIIEDAMLAAAEELERLSNTPGGLNRDVSAGTSHSEPDGSATKPATSSSQDGASQGAAPILSNVEAPQAQGSNLGSREGPARPAVALAPSAIALKPLNVTVWKDGSYLCQSEGDDYYSRNDPEWLCSIPLVPAYQAAQTTHQNRPTLGPKENAMRNLSEHPLLMQAYELCVKVDELPACVEQTNLISDLQRWREELYAHLKAQGLLKP